MNEWCDICDKSDCYHLSASEQAHKALDENLARSPLETWICLVCPERGLGDNVCKHDCKTCGGCGLVRSQMKDLKVYHRTPPTTEDVYEDFTKKRVNFRCPHCKAHVYLYVNILPNPNELSTTKWNCYKCKQDFSASITAS